MLQDAYMRFAGAPREPIRSLKSCLSTIVTRLCLDRLKAARSVREQYLGPWLPEPILTVDADVDMRSAPPSGTSRSRWPSWCCWRR